MVGTFCFFIYGTRGTEISSHQKLLFLLLCVKNWSWSNSSALIAGKQQQQQQWRQQNQHHGIAGAPSHLSRPRPIHASGNGVFVQSVSGACGFETAPCSFSPTVGCDGCGWLTHIITQISKINVVACYCLIIHDLWLPGMRHRTKQNTLGGKKDIM